MGAGDTETRTELGTPVRRHKRRGAAKWFHHGLKVPSSPVDRNPGSLVTGGADSCRQERRKIRAIPAAASPKGDIS
jgi:hypothetical protein